MTSFHHNLNHCASQFTSDDILHLFANDKSSFLSNLKPHPILSDNHCLHNLGQTDTNLSLGSRVARQTNLLDNLVNYYTCSHCKYLSRLMDYKQTPLGTPFDIHWSELAEGTAIVLPKSTTSPLPLSTELSLAWYLEHLFENFNWSPIIKHYTAFVCKNTGYLLTEYCPPLLQQIVGDPTMVYDILCQLFAILSKLLPYNFSHGATIDSLVLSDKPCEYMYNGKVVKSDQTLKFKNFHDSSITLENGQKLGPMVRPPKYFHLTNPTTMETLKVFIPNNSTKHIAFDAYCFILGLASHPSIYQEIINNSKLTCWWNGLWFPDDKLKITRNLGKEMDGKSITASLVGLKLRSDIVAFSCQQLK